MPNISSIGAGMYTSLAYSTLPVVEGTASANTEIGKLDDPSIWVDAFESGDTTNGFTVVDTARNIGRIREFPNLGIPANIVNVPQYGQAVSSQIAGQSDAPSMDFTFNYVPTEHAFIEEMRSSGELFLFRVRLANAKQDVSQATIDTGGGVNLPTVDDDGNIVESSDFYFFGKVASFEIVPNLTDSNQLNVSMTIDGEMVGPATYTADGATYE
jgi:hypothetical protein